MEQMKYTELNDMEREMIEWLRMIPKEDQQEIVDKIEDFANFFLSKK